MHHNKRIMNKKPTYTASELYKIIRQCNDCEKDMDTIREVDAIIIKEKKRYTLVELYTLQKKIKEKLYAFEITLLNKIVGNGRKRR